MSLAGQLELKLEQELVGQRELLEQASLEPGAVLEWVPAKGSSGGKLLLDCLGRPVGVVAGAGSGFR